ncbi:MAG: hypothetical protein GY839_02280 [candidate division Zixibacteria bacterium]|nr:hypothetical protein [candidate division Zixibacteria bacterium]
MNFVRICIATLLIGSTVLCAADADTITTGDSVYISYGAPEYHKMMFNPDLNMETGAENIITVNYLSGLAVDNLIGNNWFSEERAIGKAGGVTCRLAKNFLIDAALDFFSVVVAHEYFGHGARYRELSVENIDYGYDLPPPYGDGGGHASAMIYDSITRDEIIGIIVGGIEAQAVINRDLSMRWMTSKRIRYRESSLYYWSFRIMFDYVMNTKNILGENIDGNDLNVYLTLLNTKAEVADLDNPRMSVSDLKSRFMINLVNPFLLYSMYSQYKTYLWDGNSTTKVPMIKLGGIAYIPALRASLTPFGPEYHLENYFHLSKKAALLDIHLGDDSFYDSWWGIDLAVQNAFQRKRLSLDINFAAWNQPGIELIRNSEGVIGDGAGGAISCMLHYDLSDKKNPLSGVIQLGYKTAGYLEGSNLEASPIFMIGLGYRK